MTTRVLRLAASVPWAISPEWLHQILAIANREGPGPEAVSAQLGRPLDNTHDVVMHGSVAVIPVVGPVMRYGSFFSAVSGATTVDTLARDLRTALESDEVTAILFDIDSPGGEVNGVHELAEMIFAARGQKPMAAYAGGTCASAAYWLASAVGEITVDATAIVGSIGVVMALPNPEAEESADIEIVSSNAPNKRPDVTTDEGRATILETVNALADVFAADVARNRGVDVSVVNESFGQGGVRVGAAAVKAGLVDKVGSFESALAALQPSTSSPARSFSATAPNSEIRPMSLHSKPTTTSTRADGDPPPEEAAKSDANPMECTACKAVGADGAKFCASCGAAYPSREGDEDDDEKEEDEETAKSNLAAICKLTGSKTSARALGTVTAWKASHDSLLGIQNSSELDKIVAKAVTERKLPKGGSALETQLRTLGARDVNAARGFAGALAPIAALAPGHREPTANTDVTGAQTHNGKRFEQLSFREQADLHISDPSKYTALLADATKRGVLTA